MGCQLAAAHSWAWAAGCERLRAAQGGGTDLRLCLVVLGARCGRGSGRMACYARQLLWRPVQHQRQCSGRRCARAVLGWGRCMYLAWLLQI